MEELVVASKKPFQPVFGHFSTDIGEQERLLGYLLPVLGEDAEELLKQVDSWWHMAEGDGHLIPEGIEIPSLASGWGKEACCHMLVKAWDSRDPVML